MAQEKLETYALLNDSTEATTISLEPGQVCVIADFIGGAPSGSGKSLHLVDPTPAREFKVRFASNPKTGFEARGHVQMFVPDPRFVAEQEAKRLAKEAAKEAKQQVVRVPVAGFTLPRKTL
jgi:hypothetical protein